MTGMSTGDLPPIQKEAYFCFSSKKDLRKFPDEARSDVGHNLDRVQRGLPPRNFDALRGVGPGVMEIKADYRGDTYHAVYVAKPVPAKAGIWKRCTCWTAFRRNRPPARAFRRTSRSAFPTDTTS